MFKSLSAPLVARLIAIQAAFLGLYASVYLLYTYLAHKPILCGASGGCEIVRLSKWAYVFGTVPRPLLGVAFYVLILMLLFLRVALRSRSRLLWRVMQAIVLFGVAESVWLFFIQWKEIGAFCIWCLTSAIAAVELGILAIFDRPVVEDDTARTEELRWMLYIFAGLTPIFFAALWYVLR